MDIFEDVGGCVMIGVVVVIVLVLITCVAVVIFGAALPDLLG